MTTSVMVSTTQNMSADSQVRYQQMPLTFLKMGQSAHVAKVRGKREVHHHLENLGFVAGAPVKVVSETNGNLIVEIKGTHVGLDKSAASRIITY